jgi:hypothetical protein
MDYLNYYRSICHSKLSQLPIVYLYKEVISGKRKVLPLGTWKKGESVIILVRYALEVDLGLKKEQIPRMNRTVIKEQKLWGALNRFKSIPKLITFVYHGRYNEFVYFAIEKCRKMQSKMQSVATLMGYFLLERALANL